MIFITYFVFNQQTIYKNWHPELGLYIHEEYVKNIDSCPTLVKLYKNKLWIMFSSKHN